MKHSMVLTSLSLRKKQLKGFVLRMALLDRLILGILLMLLMMNLIQKRNENY